jgi:hypothetical protein
MTPPEPGLGGHREEHDPRWTICLQPIFRAAEAHDLDQELPAVTTLLTVSADQPAHQRVHLQACHAVSYLLRAGCSSKKRMSSALASGPRGSV